jgi:putative Mg2+ transporter-C (MgtC) family protein
VPELGWIELLLRVVLAGVLAGAIGAERERRERGAGLRTHLLVGVGSALFTMVSAYAWTDWQFSSREGLVFDPTRIAAQIVSGIGFLGAGAIIRQGLSVRGLTTAATLWVVAAIGMASGVGYYEGALVTTGVVLVALGPLRAVSRRLLPHTQQARLIVTLRSPAGGAVLLDALARARVRVRSLEFDEEGGQRRVDAMLVLPEGTHPPDLIANLMASDEVVAAEWEE